MCGGFFTKYAWVKPMKDKKDKKVLKAFIKIMNDSITNQINYWLMKEKNFIIVILKNGLAIMTF